MHIVLPPFRFSAPSPDLPFRAYEHVKGWRHRASRCASRHVRVELRANQVIPPAEEAIITAYSINVESLNDEMPLKATAPLVLQGAVVALLTLSG